MEISVCRSDGPKRGSVCLEMPVGRRQVWEKCVARLNHAGNQKDKRFSEGGAAAPAQTYKDMLGFT